jgi:ribosome-binding factor A
MSVRSDKVASLLKEELSTIFQRNFAMEEYGFLTITEVRMSPDLRMAKVYVSVYGDKERKMKSFSMLEAQKSSIRSMLGRVIHLRFTPEIAFYLDESIDRVFRIESIFKKIHEQDEPRENSDNL